MKSNGENLVQNKTKNRKLVTVSLIVISILVIFGIVSATTGLTTRMFEIGRKYIDMLNNKTDILYKGDHLVLYYHYSFDGLEPIEKEKAIEKALYNKAIYCIALSEGIKVEDEDINNYINVTREGLAESSNREEFDAMLAGMGMSEEEYWNSTLVHKEIEEYYMIMQWSRIQYDRISSENIGESEEKIKELYNSFKETTAKQFLIDDNVKKIND